MKNNKQKSIKELVYSYPTQHKMGFTEAELDDLLTNFPNLSLEKFNKELGVITCMVNEKGECIIYKHDVLKGLHFSLTNDRRRLIDFD